MGWNLLIGSSALLFPSVCADEAPLLQAAESELKFHSYG